MEGAVIDASTLRHSRIADNFRMTVASRRCVSGPLLSHNSAKRTITTDCNGKKMRGRGTIVRARSGHT